VIKKLHTCKDPNNIINLAASPMIVAIAAEFDNLPKTVKVIKTNISN